MAQTEKKVAVATALSVITVCGFAILVAKNCSNTTYGGTRMFVKPARQFFATAGAVGVNS